MEGSESLYCWHIQGYPEMSPNGNLNNPYATKTSARDFWKPSGVTLECVMLTGNQYMAQSSE